VGICEVCRSSNVTNVLTHAGFDIVQGLREFWYRRIWFSKPGWLVIPSSPLGSANNDAVRHPGRPTWKIRFLDDLAGRELRPVAAWRHEDIRLATSLRETNVRHAESLGQLDGRLGLDQIKQLLA
jgi:hypothetical protein